jgi:hypothetical protein
MTFSPHHEVTHTEIDKLFKTRKNNLWTIEDDILYFYPVKLSELKDIFDDHEVFFDETNFTQFVVKMIEYFQNHERENSPIDSKVVREIANEQQ